jgi:hypothetical protein
MDVGVLVRLLSEHRSVPTVEPAWRHARRLSATDRQMAVIAGLVLSLFASAIRMSGADGAQGGAIPCMTKRRALRLEVLQLLNGLLAHSCALAFHEGFQPDDLLEDFKSISAVVQLFVDSVVERS